MRLMIMIERWLGCKFCGWHVGKFSLHIKLHQRAHARKHSSQFVQFLCCCFPLLLAFFFFFIYTYQTQLVMRMISVSLSSVIISLPAYCCVVSLQDGHKSLVAVFITPTPLFYQYTRSGWYCYVPWMDGWLTGHGEEGGQGTAHPNAAD